jgi:hypothetical protein
MIISAIRQRDGTVSADDETIHSLFADTDEARTASALRTRCR